MNGTPVTTGLPSNFDEVWQYSLDELVNDRQVDVTIEQRWLLEGLEETVRRAMWAPEYLPIRYEV